MTNKLPMPNTDYFEEYTLWLQNQQMANNTIQNYLFGLRHILSNAKTVESYFADPQLRGKKLKVYAYRSYLKFLTKKMKVMDRGDLMDALDTIKAPKKLGNGHSDRKWSVIRDRWEDYVECAPNPVASMAIWIGFQFGLRAGEIIHLRINDVDIWWNDQREYHTNTIQIRAHTKSKSHDSWHPKYNRERQVPVTEDQAEIFRRWVNEVRPDDLKHDYLLWVSSGKYKGSRISGKRLLYWCWQTGENIGLQNGRKFRPHVLRYSFATHYYQVSKDVKLVCDLLGHSNVSITSEYLQLGQKETMDKARELFGMT